MHPITSLHCRLGLKLCLPNEPKPKEPCQSQSIKVMLTDFNNHRRVAHSEFWLASWQGVWERLFLVNNPIYEQIIQNFALRQRAISQSRHFKLNKHYGPNTVFAGFGSRRVFSVPETEIVTFWNDLDFRKTNSQKEATFQTCMNDWVKRWCILIASDLSTLETIK